MRETLFCSAALLKGKPPVRGARLSSPLFSTLSTPSSLPISNRALNPIALFFVIPFLNCEAAILFSLRTLSLIRKVVPAQESTAVAHSVCRFALVH
jgi:hypothetical protein